VERQAIEFHDSTVKVIRWTGVDAVLEMNVYVHSSERRPGWDEGRGWYQDAEMVLVEAEFQQRSSGDFLDIMDGSVRVDTQVFNNVMPLPCDMAGKVAIASPATRARSLRPAEAFVSC
jgi:hypothetical protein